LRPLGFDGYTMAVKSGRTTDAAGLDAAERRRILALFDRYNLTLAGISGQTSLLPDADEELAQNLALIHGYIDLTADLQRPGQPLPLCMTAGGRPDQWEAAKDRLVERFGELARRGSCDYVAILKALKRVGYDGFVDVEISIMVQRRPGYDPLAVAEQSYRVLSRAFEEAGIERRRAT